MILVEADEIVKNLWQGSFPPSGSYVRDSGFQVLVLAAEELQEPASSYPGVQVIHAPNYDDGVHRLNRDDLQIAIQAGRQVADAVRAGRKTLSTCAAGMNRSGLVTAIALHVLFGWDGNTCVQRVRKQRRSKRGLTPLSNMEFVEAVIRLPSAGTAPPGWTMSASGLILPV